MPNVNDLNEYVVAGEDIVDNDTIKFMNGGEIQNMDDGRQVLQMKVKLPNGDVKKMSINRTSANSLKDVYGADTEAWENREAIVTIATQNVKGQMKKVVYLLPVKKA